MARTLYNKPVKIAAKSKLFCHGCALGHGAPSGADVGGTRGSCLSSQRARRGDREALSLRAGLHFRQRHLGAPGAPQAREKRGGETRTPETQQYPPQIAAAAGRAPTAQGTRAAAGPRTPLGLRARGAGMLLAASPCRTGRERHRGGDKGSRPRARAPGLAARVGRPRGRGVARARRPRGAVEGRAGDYLCGGGGARRVTAGDGELLPTAARAHLWGWVGGRP